MSTVTGEISGPAAETLRHLVEAERRSEAEIVRDALEAYTPSKRRLPKGAGMYHSGRSDTSENAEQILRERTQR